MNTGTGAISWAEKAWEEFIATLIAKGVNNVSKSDAAKLAQLARQLSDELSGNFGGWSFWVRTTWKQCVPCKSLFGGTTTVVLARIIHGPVRKTGLRVV